MSSDLWIKLAVQFGFPMVLATGFCYWFFLKHIPSLRDETQRRFAEMKEDHHQALLSQERAMERHGELFQAALNQIVTGMSEGFKELKEAIEKLQVIAGVTDGYKSLKEAIERLQDRFQPVDRRRKTEENPSFYVLDRRKDDTEDPREVA